MTQARLARAAATVAILTASMAGAVGGDLQPAAAAGTNLSIGNVAIAGPSSPDDAVADYTGAGASSPLNVIQGADTGLAPRGTTRGVVIGSGGTIYVVCDSCSTTGSAIESFPSDADGDATPSAVISGADTGLAGSVAIAITPDERDLWIANYDDNSLTEYAMSATGDAAPLRTISGSNTALNHPEAITVSPDGSTLFVVEATGSGAFPVGFVLTFPITANGNVAPSSVITGPQTGLQNPQGVAVTADGMIHVVDGGANALINFAAGAHGDAKPFSTLAQSGLEFGGAASLDSVGNLWTGVGENATRISGVSTTHPYLNGTINTGGDPDVSGIAVWGEAPYRPGIPIATGGNRQVKLSWPVPTYTGGGIVGYQVLAATKATGPFTPIGASASTSYTATGLTAGKTEYFEMKAFNDRGYSTASVVTSATPYGPPSAPRSLKLKPAKTAIAASWTKPSSTGGKTITGYVVKYATCKIGPKSCHAKSLSATATHAKIAGLKAKKTYYFTVAAKSSAGTGTATGPKKVKTT